MLIFGLAISLFGPSQLRSQERTPLGARFLSAPAKGDPLDLVLRHVRNELPGKAKSARGGRLFSRRDFTNPRVRERHTGSNNGVTHLYLQQEANGLPIYLGDIQAHVAADGSIIALHNRFVGAQDAAPAAVPQRSASECLQMAATALQLPAPAILQDLSLGAIPTEARFAEPSISLDPIPAKLLYFPLEDGTLRLAWNYVVRTPDRRRWLDVNVDAETGRILSQVNWVHAAASYRVAALPLEGPGEGPRTLLSGVEDSLASPFGWHDTNGIAGPEFTDTRGNNVQAQTDPTGFDAVGIRPDGGATLTFDFATDFGASASTNAEAAVTNLFFLTNVCHDIFYRHGFDESAGNFQTNNYGRGGSSGDAIMADAQDAASSNNASFSSPPDGLTPRMEMGLIAGVVSLEVTEPSSIAGALPTVSAAFGPSVAGTITGTVVLGTDDTINGPSATDCCGALTNASSVNGKITLIDRGDCNFTVKVKNAQDAGAVAVIMVNNAGDDLVTMSGEDATITIPSVFIGQTNGQRIKDALAQGVQVRLEGLATPDTSFDTTVIVHEFAHGVTTRLTGGPSDANSLDGTIPGGMGEGWSDFFALVFTAKPADTRNTPRRIGQYSFDPAGIRSFPYSSDLSINPLTYTDVRTRTEVHAVGEVWSAMLWEVYWNLVETHGFDTSLYGGPGGNNLALQLVIDGCKLQPSNPNFLQARDAILQADLVNNAGANQFALWQAFAKRGLGLSATAGISASDNQVTAAFDTPPALDTADPAGEGLPNLIRAAFNTGYGKPNRANLPAPVETAVRSITFKQLKGGTGTPGIDYHVNGVNYLVEVSDNLQTWDSGPTFVEHVSTTPDPDGITDTVIVRALQAQPFFRVRITRSVAP